MQKFGSVSRVLAAAVSSALVVVTTPSFGFTISVNGTAVTSCGTPIVDSLGNITLNCSTTAPPTGGPAPPPPPPPPPVDGAISCSGIPGIKNTRVIPVTWQTTIGTGVTTKAAGGFAPGEAVVFVLKPTAGASSGGKYGSFRVSPSDGNSYNTRIMSVSATPCDFTRSMGTASVKQGQEPTVYFSVGGYPVDRYGRPVTSNANLTSGQTYYVTVINQLSVGGENSCMSSSCNVNYGLIPGM